MAKRMKVCKICGKEYDCCASPSDGYKWSDVACCKEHGSEYLKKVLASRGEDNQASMSKSEPKPEVKEDAKIQKFKSSKYNVKETGEEE